MGLITDLLKEIPLSSVLKERLAEKEAENVNLRTEKEKAEAARDSAIRECAVKASDFETKIHDLNLLVEQKDQEIKRLHDEIQYLKDRQSNPPSDPGSWMAS